MNRKIKIIAAVSILVCLLIIIFFNTLLRDVVYSVFIAFVIAYSLKPIQNKLLDKGISRKISSFLLIAVFAAFFGTILFVLIPNIIKETSNLSYNMQHVGRSIEHIHKRLENLNRNKYLGGFSAALVSKLEVMGKASVNRAIDSIIKKKESLLSLAVLPVMIYYFLADGETISKSVMNLIPLKRRGILKNLGRDINIVLSRYIISQLLLSGLVGILTFIVLEFLGVNYPVILSILNGIFNIIPYFGPTFGAIPAIFIALLKSTKTAIWTSVLLYIIQQVEGDIISPKITGDSVDMHPLWIILILIIGGKIGGFIGMVLAIPIAVAIKVVIEDLDYYMY